VITRSTFNSGQTGEYLAAAELARLGFAVSVLGGIAADIDLLAYGYKKTLPVQVKSASHKNFRFDARKFVSIDFPEGQSQIVNGPREDLDQAIVIALVSIGGTLKESDITWTTIGSFSRCLAHYQKWNLGRLTERNPGTRITTTQLILSLNDIRKELDELRTEDVLGVSAPAPNEVF